MALTMYVASSDCQDDHISSQPADVSYSQWLEALPRRPVRQPRRRPFTAPVPNTSDHRYVNAVHDHRTCSDIDVLTDDAVPHGDSHAPERSGPTEVALDTVHTEQEDPINADSTPRRLSSSASLTEDLLNLAGNQFARVPFERSSSLPIEPDEEGANQGRCTNRNVSYDEDDVLLLAATTAVPPTKTGKKRKMDYRRSHRRLRISPVAGKLSLNELHLQLFEGEGSHTSQEDDQLSPASSSEDDPIEYTQAEQPQRASPRSVQSTARRKRPRLHTISELRLALAPIDSDRAPKVGWHRFSRANIGDGFNTQERILPYRPQSSPANRKRKLATPLQPRGFPPLTMQLLSLVAVEGIGTDSQADVEVIDPTQAQPSDGDSSESGTGTRHSADSEEASDISGAEGEGHDTEDDTTESVDEAYQTLLAQEVEITDVGSSAVADSLQRLRISQAGSPRNSPLR